MSVKATSAFPSSKRLRAAEKSSGMLSDSSGKSLVESKVSGTSPDTFVIPLLLVRRVDRKRGTTRHACGNRSRRLTCAFPRDTKFVVPLFQNSVKRSNQAPIREWHGRSGPASGNAPIHRCDKFHP